MATGAKEDRALAKVQVVGADNDALNDKVVAGEVVDKDGKTYDYVELADKKFRVREKIGALAMLKWAAASEMDTNDPRALGAIYAMIRSVILKADWADFEATAMDEDSDAEELLDVVSKALEIVAGRPTKQS